MKNIYAKPTKEFSEQIQKPYEKAYNRRRVLIISLSLQGYTLCEISKMTGQYYDCVRAIVNNYNRGVNIFRAEK